VAEIKLGVVTDTWDFDGKILEENKIGKINIDEVYSILKKLTGKKMQMPPKYSAVKFEGRPSYHFARKGLKVNLSPRIVNIYDIKLVSLMDDLITIKVRCGSGTYIRSLAHEIGEIIGCGASVKKLKRTKIGEFDVKDSIAVKDFIAKKMAGNNFKYGSYILSLKKILEKSPSLYIKDEYRKSILNGHKVKSEMLQSGKTKTGTALKKEALVQIKDIRGSLMAVHRVLTDNAFSDIKQKGIALTGSIIVIEDYKILND
jgi:tRNA pseudouridine55 synthase